MTKLTPERIRQLPPEKATLLAANMFIGFKKAVGTLAEIQKIFPTPKDNLEEMSEEALRKVVAETREFLYKGIGE